MSKTHKLERSLSLFSITMYGIGSILGAGIYVLVGKVSGFAGFFAPFSFLLAAIIAAFTAISYARLSSRIPKSGGEFAYVSRAFKSPIFAQIVAMAVMFTGIVSAATMANGFVGYLQVFIGWNENIIITAFVVMLGVVSIWGIKESAFLVTSFAFVEFAGLLFVLFCLKENFAELPLQYNTLIPSANWLNFSAILSGAFLAFFAFIGFEDMVNIAEEVKNPRRNMPISIIIALIVTSFIYILVSLAATISLSPQILQNSSAPMADLIHSKGYSPKIISAVSLFSISNGAVVQMVMASRILFSMARKSILPQLFQHINQHTKTPIYSTAVIILAVLGFALFLNLETLAETTSFIILSVFIFINLSLIVIQYSGKDHNIVERVTPFLGLLLTSGMIIFKLHSLL